MSRNKKQPQPTHQCRSDYAVATCRHLCEEKGLVYCQTDRSPDHPFVLALCEKCDDFLAEQGGMTDETAQFVDLRIVCPTCFHKKMREQGNVELAA